MTTAALIPGPPPTAPGLLERLHERLEARATGDAAPDVHYRTVDSPVGRLLVAATEAGVARVAFEREGEEAVLQSLADRIGPRILRTPKRLDDAARWFDAYFAGASDPFGLPLDTRLARGFRLEVLDRLRQVPYGERVSYAALAARTSSPKAVRAVGTACATNPLPLVIPCHRVTRSDGSVGAYLGGPDTKVRLLALETTGALPS
jgi:methylated-DNA-[protein]-cysteine S-methyltransferase